MNNDEKPIPKYCIVPVFWNNVEKPFEIEVIDIVASYDNTGKVYLNFIDTDGRMWKGGLEQFVVIKNLPDKEDIEDFQRMKRESEEAKKDILKKREELEKIKNNKDDAFR